MIDDALLRDLRAEIHQLGPSSPSRRYPVALKARIVMWSSRRRRAGASAREVEEALGIPWESLGRWLREEPAPVEPPKPARLRPVRVTIAPASTSPGLVLRTPRGFSVEGLDVAAIAELLERLG